MEQFKEEQFKAIDTLMRWFRHNADNWNTKGTCRRSISVETKDGGFDILNMEYTNEEHSSMEDDGNGNING